MPDWRILRAIEPEELRDDTIRGSIQVELDEMRATVRRWDKGLPRPFCEIRMFRKYERWLNRMWLRHADLMNGAQTLQSIEIGHALEAIADGLGIKSRLIPDGPEES